MKYLKYNVSSLASRDTTGDEMKIQALKEYLGQSETTELKKIEKMLKSCQRDRKKYGKCIVLIKLVPHKYCLINHPKTQCLISANTYFHIYTSVDLGRLSLVALF